MFISDITLIFWQHYTLLVAFFGIGISVNPFLFTLSFAFPKLLCGTNCTVFFFFFLLVLTTFFIPDASLFFTFLLFINSQMSNCLFWYEPFSNCMFHSHSSFKSLPLFLIFLTFSDSVWWVLRNTLTFNFISLLTGLLCIFLDWQFGSYASLCDIVNLYYNISLLIIWKMHDK